MKYLVGIDEAGRGPLAGPVAVGVVKVRMDFDWNLLEGVGDSKRLTAKKREMLFEQANLLKERSLLDGVVTFGSAQDIDEKGVTVVIRSCIAEALEQLKLDPKECFIKLDGSLRAPVQFAQETIVRGDSKELVIGMASIYAKVVRDRYMFESAKRYPLYEFATHKGYGTKLHRQKINEWGLSPEHRVSYCQNRHLWGKV